MVTFNVIMAIKWAQIKPHLFDSEKQYNYSIHEDILFR